MIAPIGDWNPKRPGKERRHWNRLSGKKGATERRKAARRFNKAFPKGHHTSLRRLVRGCADYVAQDKPLGGAWWWDALPDIHPDAFEILHKYGKDYRPRRWAKPPPFGEPKRAACFLNATILAHVDRSYCEKQKLRRPPMEYVEGVAMGVYVRPMLHAWNGIGLHSREAIDWTHYAACRWTRYIGIPFTHEEHAELRALTPLGRSVHLMMHKKYFTPAARDRMIEILEARKQKRSRKK